MKELAIARWLACKSIKFFVRILDIGSFDISLSSSKIKLEYNNISYSNENLNINNYSINTSLGSMDNSMIGPNYYLICKKCKNEMINSRILINFNGKNKHNESICYICGNDDFKLIDETNYFEYREKIISGDVNVMNYSSVKVTSKCVAVNCPICGNYNKYEHIFCEICGAYLLNRCTGSSLLGFNEFIRDPTYLAYQNDYEHDLISCKDGQKLNGNCRFCPFCGSVTSFYMQQFLKPYNKDLETNKDNTSYMIDN